LTLALETLLHQHLRDDPGNPEEEEVHPELAELREREETSLEEFVFVVGIHVVVVAKAVVISVSQNALNGSPEEQADDRLEFAGVLTVGQHE